MAAEPLYTESAYYRMLFAERAQDLPFYLRATADLHEGDEVLELGVGDGRVALPLASHGRTVLGVDNSASMLAALESNVANAQKSVGDRVRYECADTRALRLPRRFARVICPFNGIAHFHGDEDLAAFFATVRAHLARDGLFAFDVMIPDPALFGGGASSVPWLRHPRTSAVCRLEESYSFDPVRQVLTITTTLIERESGSSQVLSLVLRQFFPEETERLLAHHGFTVIERDESIGDSIAYLCRLSS